MPRKKSNNQWAPGNKNERNKRTSTDRNPYRMNASKDGEREQGAGKQGIWKSLDKYFWQLWIFDAKKQQNVNWKVLHLMQVRVGVRVSLYVCRCVCYPFFFGSRCTCVLLCLEPALEGPGAGNQFVCIYWKLNFEWAATRAHMLRLARQDGLLSLKWLLKWV